MRYALHSRIAQKNQTLYSQKSFIAIAWNFRFIRQNPSKLFQFSANFDFVNILIRSRYLFWSLGVPSYLITVGYFYLRNYFRLLQLWTLQGPINFPNIRGKARFHVNSKWTSLVITFDTDPRDPRYTLENEKNIIFSETRFAKDIEGTLQNYKFRSEKLFINKNILNNKVIQIGSFKSMFPKFLSRDTQNQNKKFLDTPTSFPCFTSFRSEVANPNRSLGRIWVNFQKYWFFGPNFDKNCEKTPKISKNRRVSIQVWAAEILFWAACGLRAAGWPPLF